MGTSGSGKSTPLNLLGCLDQPTGALSAGRVGHRQRQARSIGRIRNRQIGFVFQNFNLIPRTSALENAQLPLFYRGVSIKEQRQRPAAAALHRVGLAGRSSIIRPTLRRSAAARGDCAALVGAPSILFADEPTGNLDTTSSREIKGILDTLNREDGITIILVTHEPLSPPTRPRTRHEGWQIVQDVRRYPHCLRCNLDLRCRHLFVLTVMTALRILSRNRLRAGLTMLGIVIGGGGNCHGQHRAGPGQRFQAQVAKVWANVIVIMPGSTTVSGV